jgi:hypothetical protein
MSSTKNIRVIAYSTIGVLVVVLIIVLAYAYYPSIKKSADIIPVQHIKIGGVSPMEANSPFNVDILNDKAYKNLNRTLLDTQKLPVGVPENRGKANLFGI